MVEKISVTILTKNSQKYLKESLNALKPFDEVIILDNGSTDSTLEIASSFDNVKIVEHEFIGFGPMKNLAAEFAKNDWIFSVDSDEIVSKELIDSIKMLNPKNIGHLYSVSRLNHYRKKAIKCCGWYPDVVTRLYNKNSARFSDAMVHESIVAGANKVVKLSGYLKHYPFDDIDLMISKIQKYSTLFSEQTNRRSSPLKAFSRATFAFFKSYFLKKGFLCGYEGILISVYNSTTVFFKYMKLYEKHKYD